MRRLAIQFLAAVLAAVVLVAHASAAAARASHSAQAIPQEWGAAGSPIFRPCGEITTSIDRMQAGLGRQQIWIQSAEQQLRDAATGAHVSREALRARAQDALGELITDQMNAMLTLRRKVEFLKTLGLSRDSRRRVLEAAKKAEDLYERAEKMKERYDGLVQDGKSFDVAKALRENTASLESFLKFAGESGLAEEGVSLLAMAGGPVGQLTASTTRVALDWGLAFGESIISERELRRAQEDLGTLRAAVERNRGIVAELEMERSAAAAAGQCPEMSAGSAQQQPSSLTPPLPERPAGPPAATPTPAPAAPKPPARPTDEKKSGMSDTLFYGGLAALVGGAYLYSEYQKTAGAQCTPASANVLTVCSSEGGSSPACQKVVAEQKAYCSCLGLGYSGGNCTG